MPNYDERGKIRCLVQSETPGRATIAEAIEVLYAEAEDIRRTVSMPAQDHIHNSLRMAISALKRLQLAEERCAKRGHDWVWAPYIKPMYPPLTDAICETCGLMKMPYESERPKDAVIASRERWGKLVGHS